MRVTDVAVWGADPGGRGWRGFLEHFLGRWWGGEWGCVVSWAKWGPTFVGFSPRCLPWGFRVCALGGARLGTFCSWFAEYGIGTLIFDC